MDLGIMAKVNLTVTNRAIRSYFTSLTTHLIETAVSSASGEAFDLAEGSNHIITDACNAHAGGNKLIFVGNGGSAAIASHMATDYSKNGGIRSLALNDGSMLTCLGNDLGYEHVFSKQIELHARPGDLFFAISSSGRPANILNAVTAARRAQCKIVTLSGFAEN